MLRIVFSAGEPPPRQPRKRTSEPPAAPEPREIYVYENGRGGWSLLEISPNGSGGLQIAHGSKRVCLQAALEWAESEPILLTIGASQCFPGDQQ